MSTRLLKTVTLLAFTAWSTLALADDPPSRVGRVAVAQGQVRISGAAGESVAAAAVNWPVTSHDLITTARGARTELRIGSTAVRLDGDSSLEVMQLDDNNLRLRLHYGSASVRIVNPEVVAGFELETPQGRIRMQEPGRLRVDAEQVGDTSSVTVFEGVAVVEGGGANLTVRAGKRAELADEDVRTAQATRDGFDDWASARDKAAASSTSSRYVSSEMTGYEDLDRYGSWSSDSQYGNLWMPSVAPGWAPYRDGSWAWIDPWGWTWVDNAPWGYAPFHYGRWVFVQKHKRWAWAPGHREHRPSWEPAQVWQNVPGAKRPPLAPPQGHRDWRRDERRDDRAGPDRGRHGDRDGIDRGRRDHGQQPPVAMPSPVLSNQPRQPVTVLTAPPVLPGQVPQSGVPNRHQPREPITVLTAPPVLPGQPAQPPQPVMPQLPEPRQPITVLTPPPVLPGQPGQQVPQPGWRDDRREQFEDRRGRRSGRWTSTDGRPELGAAQPPVAAPAPLQAVPAPMAAEPRFGRGHRGEGDFDRRERAPAPMPPQAAAPPPPRPPMMPQPAPMPPQAVAPPPQMARPVMPISQPAPPPAPAAAPAPAPASVSPSRRGEGRRGDDNVRQQER